MWGTVAWNFLVALAKTKIGRCLIGLAIIGFFYLGFRIWLPIHDASVAREARAGYVLLQEKLAAEALANEYRRQIVLAQQIREHADREAEQLDIEAQQRREADEKAIADDKQADGATVGADDLDWLQRVRKPR
jgi:hypothetical protein